MFHKLIYDMMWDDYDFYAGSKEEAFFDSQPWLDSDGEDDFLSVNGGKEKIQQHCFLQTKFDLQLPPSSLKAPTSIKIQNFLSTFREINPA